MSPRPFRGVAAALLLGLAVLVGYLAKVQWDWLGRLEVYEHARLNGTTGQSGMYFKWAFDSEIERLAASFRAGAEPDLEAQVVAGLERWRARSRWPALLKDVLVAREGPGGEIELARFEAATATFQPLGASAEARRCRDALVALHARGARAAAGPEVSERPALLVASDLPAVLIETRLAPSQPGGGLAAGWLVLRLDRDTLQREFLPALTRLFFVPPNFDQVDVAVVAARSGELVYSNLPISSLDDFGRVATTYGLVDAGTDGEELPRLGSRPPSGGEAPPNSLHPPSAADHRWFRRLWARSVYSGYWQLFLRRGPVSIAEEVAAARRRTLIGSFAALALISLAAGLIFVLARRAQRLAEDQLAFVASVSHELRTPLAILSAAGENLSDALAAEPAKVREYGSLIQDETLRLREMVENLLHLARKRSGVAGVERQPLDVTEVVEGALRRAKRQIEQAGFAVEVALEPCPQRVLGNPRALQAALANLISNALKYGQPARWMRVAVQSAAAPPGEVQISVEDHGMGIAKSEQGRLFEPFFRSARVRRDQVEGSGLGLAVVRDVAEAHGGRVTVESRPGEGSRFTLHLPVLEGL